MTTHTKHSCQRGATGLAITIVMFVSVLLAVATRFFSLGGITETQKSTASYTDLERISRALVAHVRTNGDLPCPAATDGGQAACTGSDFGGYVPWRTLGLTKQDSRDGFGRAVSYFVDRNRTTPSAANATLKIIENIGDTPPAENMAYVLVSHGENGLGALSHTGLGNPASQAEQKNTVTLGTDAALFTNPTYFVEKPANTAGAAASYFDDFVLAQTETGLFFPDEEEEEDTPPGADVTFSPEDLVNYVKSDGKLPGNKHDLVPVTLVPDPAGDGTQPGGIDLGTENGDYASCFWWPDSFTLVDNSANNKNTVMRAYYKFALPLDAGGTAFGTEYGFMFAFISAKGFPQDESDRKDELDKTCGSAYQHMGYSNHQGKEILPKPRFAIEVDTHKTDYDPDYSHFAIVRNEQTHSNGNKKDDNGPLCIPSSPSGPYNKQPEDRGTEPPQGCYHGGLLGSPNPNWLENGPTVYHKVRVEVRHNNTGNAAPGCGPGNIYVSAWLWEDEDAACNDCRDLTKDMDDSPTTADAHITDCREPFKRFDIDDMEEVFFGFTYGTRSSSNITKVRDFGFHQETY